MLVLRLAVTAVVVVVFGIAIVWGMLLESRDLLPSGQGNGLYILGLPVMVLIAYGLMALFGGAVWVWFVGTDPRRRTSPSRESDAPARGSGHRPRIFPSRRGSVTSRYVSQRPAAESPNRRVQERDS